MDDPTHIFTFERRREDREEVERIRSIIDSMVAPTAEDANDLIGDQK
jgi:hypothetical protein